MTHPLHHIYRHRLRSRHHAVTLLIALLILFFPTDAMADIVIGGNVYGGGNEGEVVGSTSVTVLHGELQNNVYGGGNIADISGHTAVTLKGGFIKGTVYGGARMADVGANTFVHIDGEHQSDALVVKAVYGGNDIAGKIGTFGALDGNRLDFTPKVETFNKANFNAFIYTTGNEKSELPYVIGSLYGGGNGAYEYMSFGLDEEIRVSIDGQEFTVENKPELDNTYIEIGGGFYGHVFGGGNNVTVRENTIIYTENKTPFNDKANRVCYEHAQIIGLDEKHYRFAEHDSHKDIVFDHHIAGLFGGNNLADMAIRPTWYLKESRINNLYSGGNKGSMTHPNGIILPLRSNELRVNNVYGGCRIANVTPSTVESPMAEEISTWDFDSLKASSYTFTEGYASRVYITGGHYNNVYGGNDISGTVSYGSNVELHGGCMVNVYGGGNGSYAYTDNRQWVEEHPEDADYYYSVPNGNTSLEALHKHRPHAESTLIYITGYEHEKPLVVAGEVYCGGNSATLATNGDRTKAKSTLRIGRHAIIDGIFLGSNGANMVDTMIVKKYAIDGFSSINLKDSVQIRSYMGSVAVNIRPRLQWDENIDKTYIGSLFYGGNKGSMTYNGMSTINVPRDVIVYEKVVGGCNDACVVETNYNAAFHGGLLERGSEYNGMDNVKICLNVDAYLRPMELELEYMDENLFVESYEFVPDTLARKPIETFDNKEITSATFTDANIYGGCYNSGHIKGDVIINISKPLIHPKVFELERSILDATGEDVYGSAMAVYGGGYGKLSVVEGNTQINFTDSASVLLAFGGGEMGVVTGNTEVNFAHDMVLPTDDTHSIAHNINVYKAYAAGYEGEVHGHSTLNLQGGGVLRGFGGACNADVHGTTTAIVGWRNEVGDEYNYGLPYVANAVFGGNDFGGQVLGDTLRTIDVKDYSGNIMNTLQVRSQSYVQYLSGNIGKALYGGSYGSYDYTRTDMYDADYRDGFKDPKFVQRIFKGEHNVIATNTFVHIASKSRDKQDIIGSATYTDPNIITGIVGGGRGYRNLPGHVQVANTYVLLNGTDYTQRDNATPMAYRVYGGGNLSVVNDTRIDAYSGTIRRIFGGTHGVKTVSTNDSVSYTVGSTIINYYEGMTYPLTDLFGAGANSGTDHSTINLYGGNVNNVHGGAYTEGYTVASEINIPQNSTIHANAIFGGGLGEEEGRPCDVGLAHINFQSELATVEMGLFGGNNTARATTESHITVSAPMRNSHGILQSVYGAGYGNATVAGFTQVELLAGAHVAKIYGGGKEGKVYNHYSYYQASDGDEKSEAYAIDNNYSKTPHHHANWKGGVIQGHTQPENPTNTLIKIRKGAVVESNVYGGGEGATAYVSGQTQVQLLGGIVKGDIYGGGDAGAMPYMTNEMNGYIQDAPQTIATLCDIQGGQVRKVFGGGLNGDIEGNTHVIVGTEEGTSFFNGIPAIQRNVYGGSERAIVTDTATVDMYNGYVGYEYDPEISVNPDKEGDTQLANGMRATGKSTDKRYKPLLDLDENMAVREFEDEGNIYGAGYGEGAVVINTQVKLHGGTVRNSVYGGGEIAAVGQGIVADTKDYAEISKPGVANVRINGGLVEGDVFGGGRGYTYTYTFTGEDSPYKTTREYTDGYVFGKTNVEIYGGTIGTDESLAQGKGNVFGGGNIGYVYSIGEKFSPKTIDISEGIGNEQLAPSLQRNANPTEERIIGHYYYREDDPNTNKEETTADRTEDCRVLVQATEDYEEGIIIRNAIFAGGNVSSGSDIVYANAVTVYGNATASIVDLSDDDLITIGGEHIGGLYGDGNLTFVDGYRELNITNYGTDYYHLASEIDLATYNTLAEHDKDYYTTAGDSYKRLEGRILNTIQRADFCGIFGSRILLYGAQDRVLDEVNYTNYALNRVGEVSLNLNEKNGHGNYFGIFNVVNFLGALTSDVKFADQHQTNARSESESTYYDHKYDNQEDESLRNKGTSSNIVAQASGVYLELVKELDANGNKVYGPLTGVIQLELLNMLDGEGGGYVYAQKEYGLRNDVIDETILSHLTLAESNEGAVTHAAFTYDQAQPQPIQTSGNFVHDSRTVIDHTYLEDAHYWYIKGDKYVYNQYISAYAGAAQTFTSSINIPICIDNSQLKLASVQPNKYAYYKEGNTPMTLDDSIQIGNKAYYLNDPISHLEWEQLNETYKNKFVDVTYVAVRDITLAGNTYKKGTVLLPAAYNNLKESDTENAFRISNEMATETGYLLTVSMSNPEGWSQNNPSFQCNKTGTYGQRWYTKDDLIASTENQGGTAVFNRAYIAIQDVTYTYNDQTKHMLKGSYISETEYMSIETKTCFKPAYMCTNTIEVGEKEYILKGELISEDQYNELNARTSSNDIYLKGKTITKHFTEAYVCTAKGSYGGKEFTERNSYDALLLCNLSNEERSNFRYNTESAFNLLSEDSHELLKSEKVLTESPTEEATLYVPYDSEIFDLSEERIYTITYTHTYGEEAEKASEDHIINLHVQFKSAQPIIDSLASPNVVLPNSTVGLKRPNVIEESAYEMLGSGWEIYETRDDAEGHKNGIPYQNNATPMYWYQNGYYVAYYAKTYLGRTYSNPVPFTIANYHRMGEVMNHPEYMHIDHADVDRAAKIYLDEAEYESTSIAAGKGEKNDLDYFYDLYTTTLDESKLDQRVKSGQNLEFILRSDIAPNVYSDWTSIGTEENSFAGTLHGNGYTISSLNNSLFGHLSGKVYNLGLKGQFTEGCIAQEGGSAENCWVYNITENATDIIHENGDVNNSYYADTQNQALFEMGEIAYLLNGFYLDKRYRLYNDDVDDNKNYVDNYFADGDFRYAKGKIILDTDERYDEKTEEYTPIYPDDYIYFGQRITYATTERDAEYKGVDLHDSLPRRIAKSENEGKIRIIRNHGNRVYRAPAYKQSSNIDKVYFNSYAHFADSCKNMPIHHSMTAIDFTGYGDNYYTDAADGYRPYLDYEGIELFTITGLTSNLLIYVNPEKDATSYRLFEDLYVPILEYGKLVGKDKYVNNYYELSEQTNLVQVHGHLVDLVIEDGDSTYVAKRNQILVDKEDFNAPIAYSFADNCYMWHQRKPEFHAETDKAGWETLCLPFTAAFTTTQDKGQITYFYGDSTANNEYWLREFKEVETSGETTALFYRPDAVEDQEEYEVENTFLYDYYYKNQNANGDSYQPYYAQEVREKEGYPYIEAYTPYIVAFPGKSYYEFDMSGQFDPDGAEGPITPLKAQVITFVSVDNAEIAVTDKAIVDRTKTANGYNYTGALTHRGHNGEYILNDGCAFQNTGGSIVPFRAYLTASNNATPHRILIGNFTEDKEEPIEDFANHGLTIYGKKDAIYIESTLEYETTIVIHSLSGQVIAKVKVMPMSRKVVTVPSPGVYIANNRKVAVL